VLNYKGLAKDHLGQVLSQPVASTNQCFNLVKE